MRDGLRVGGGLAFGLEGSELIEGFVEEALGLVAEAVDAGDGGLVHEGVAAPGFAALVVGHAVEGGAPDFGFDPAVAAEEPFIMDEGIDEGAFGGSSRGVLGGEGGFESLELSSALLADDDAVAVEARFEGVPAGRGLALDGAWAGGELGVAAVGRDLFFGRHK